MDGFTLLIGLVAMLCAFVAASIVMGVDTRDPMADDHAR
jgi:hypothetical protein